MYKMITFSVLTVFSISPVFAYQENGTEMKKIKKK